MSVTVCTPTEPDEVTLGQRYCVQWDWFRSEVSRVDTYEEAVNFLHRRHVNSTLLNRLFSNLSVLVHTLSIPDDMTWEEVAVFLNLVSRWRRRSANLFPAGALESAEDHLSRILACPRKEGDVVEDGDERVVSSVAQLIYGCDCGRDGATPSRPPPHPGDGHPGMTGRFPVNPILWPRSTGPIV